MYNPINIEHLHASASKSLILKNSNQAIERTYMPNKISQQFLEVVRTTYRINNKSTPFLEVEHVVFNLSFHCQILL